jgi:hypothetical protein
MYGSGGGRSADGRDGGPAARDGCITSSLQMPLGQRVSWLWCGQRLLAAPGYEWSGWLAQQWESLRRSVAAAPAMPVPAPALEEALDTVAMRLRSVDDRKAMAVEAVIDRIRTEVKSRIDIGEA